MFTRRKLLVTMVAALLLTLLMSVTVASAQEAALGGSANFRDGASLSDSLVISLTGAPVPAAGTAYEGWLVSSGGKISTGILAFSGGALTGTYESSSGTNLLSAYDTFVITEEDAVGPTVLIALNELNSSGQSGWARLDSEGAQTLVTLQLSSGTLQTEAVHIHAGQCGDTLGGVTNSLTSFVGGSGASVTTVAASLESLLTGGFAINTHEAGNAGNYTACGNIPARASTVTFALGELNSSGQSGQATLTARGINSTEVVLSVSSGALQTEAVHIHSGQCGDTLGGVAHGLTSFVGGSGTSITTVAAGLSSLRTGGFAINSHEAGNASNYTTCGNIPALRGTALYSDTIPAGVFLHVGHLLVAWPSNPDGKGITVGLREQANDAFTHANLAANSTTLAAKQTHSHHVINIIQGVNGANYDASFAGPGDGFGVLNYAADTIKHADFAKTQAPDDNTVVAMADESIAASNNVIARSNLAVEAALDVVNASSDNLAVSVGLVNAVNNTRAALEGSDENADGALSGAEGGANTAYTKAQDIAQFELQAGGPTPPVTGDLLVPIAALMVLIAGLLFTTGGGLVILRRRRMA